MGSIPTAIIVSKIVMKDDIRNRGSGNAGATNVFRVMGWKPALFVVLVDVGKGTIATLFISKIGGNAMSWDPIIIQIIAGLSAIVGHIWTVFAGFRGGKGVGTALGVLLVLAPWASLCTLGVWVLLVFTSRIVSIGSIAAGIVFPGILFLQRYGFETEIPDPLLILGIILGILVVVTHRSNIGRLLRGKENRFGSKRQPLNNTE